MQVMNGICWQRRELPQEESYDGYLQLENGVGMLRLLFNEFEEAFGKLTGDDRVGRTFRCNRKAGVSVYRQDGTARCRRNIRG